MRARARVVNACTIGQQSCSSREKERWRCLAGAGCSHLMHGQHTHTHTHADVGRAWAVLLCSVARWDTGAGSFTLTLMVCLATSSGSSEKGCGLRFRVIKRGRWLLARAGTPAS